MDLEASGVVSELRLSKLRTRWNIPPTDTLVRVFSCVYKKPRPSHGKMYIFPNHIVFVSHSHHTNVCIPFAEVEQMLRKRHRIHLITANNTHRLRSGLAHNSSVYEVLLAVWQHARGDTSIDLASIRAEDKRMKKAARKGDRRGSLTDTASEIGTESVDDDDLCGVDEGDLGDDSEDESEPTLESATITTTGPRSTSTATMSPAPPDVQVDSPRQPEIALSTLDAVPFGFAATLVPPEDIQVVGRAGPVTLKAGLEHCWRLLFASDSQNVIRTMTAHNLKDIVLGEWVPDREEAGVMTRTVKYSKPVQNVLVKGEAVVEQTQRAVMVSLPTKRICLWQESRMQGVPYSDSFVVRAVYELTEESGRGGRATNVAYTAWVFWTKSPPRFLRGKIERGSVEGAEESFKGFMADSTVTLLEERPTSPTPAPSRSARSPAPSFSSSSPSSPSPSPPQAAGGAPPPPANIHNAAVSTSIQDVTNTTNAAGVTMTPTTTTTTTKMVGGIEIDAKFVYGVVAVLLFSIITNVILAATRAG